MRVVDGVDVGRAIVVSLALALLVPAVGCHKKEGGSSPPTDTATAGEAQAPEESNDPVAELAELEGRMRAYGLPTAAERKGAETGESEDAVTTEVGQAGAGDNEGRAEEIPNGAPTPTAVQVDGTEPMRDQSINYCGDLCSLSESICSLEVRICSLAEAHADDTIYADACERAVEDCKVAGEACDGCG